MKPRDIKKAAIAQRCAECTGVTVRSVRRVINGEQQNEVVMGVYMQIVETNEIADQIIKQSLQQELQPAC